MSLLSGKNQRQPYAIYVCHSFPSKEQASFNFMVAITVCSDSGAQENKICHYFHSFPTRRSSDLMSLLFNTLTRFVIAFLPRSKHLLISWLQAPSNMILEPKKIKSVTSSTFSPFICHEVMEPDVMIFVFLMLNFKPAFSVSSFTFIKKKAV